MKTVLTAPSFYTVNCFPFSDTKTTELYNVRDRCINNYYNFVVSPTSRVDKKTKSFSCDKCSYIAR